MVNRTRKNLPGLHGRPDWASTKEIVFVGVENSHQNPGFGIREWLPLDRIASALSHARCLQVNPSIGIAHSINGPSQHTESSDVDNIENPARTESERSVSHPVCRKIYRRRQWSRQKNGSIPNSCAFGKRGAFRWFKEQCDCLM